MNKLQLYSCLFFLLAWRCAFGQIAATINVEDGLPSNHVYTIVQDAKGFVWFLTDRGMARYNGTEIKTFTTQNGLPNNDVWDALPTPDGKVWYLTKASSLGYAAQDTVISFPNAETNTIINPIFSSQIGNKVYPSGADKSYNLQQGKWVKNKIKNGSITHHKDIALLKINDSLSAKIAIDHKGKERKRFYFKRGLNNYTRGQITDSLYYFIDNVEYHILNLNTLEITQKTFASQINMAQLPHARINMVNGQLQLTGGGFVGVFDQDFNITSPFYFPKEWNAHFGLIDRSNTLWCATFNNGVLKVPLAKRKAAIAFKDKKIQSLNLVQGKLIAGVYQEGLFRYDPTAKNFRPLFSPSAYNYGAFDIAALGTTYYLTKSFIASERHNKQLPLLGHSKENLIKTNGPARHLIYYKQQLFGSFSFGIHQLDPETLTIINSYKQRGINDILAHGDHLYIGTSNGLKILQNNRIVPSSLGKVLLTNKSILSLKAVDSSTLLINTDGFGAYLAQNNKVIQLAGTKFISVKNAFVTKNDLWLATNKGVLHYQKTSQGYQLNNQFNANNGLPTTHINAIAVLGETLFMATDNGLISLPKNTKQNPLFLAVYVDKSKYGNQEFTQKDSLLYQPNQSVQFRLGAINFEEGQELQQWEHQLWPVQPNWVSSTGQTLSFNELPPNNYTLKIKQMGKVASYEFTILPLWWQRPLFRWFVGISMVLLVLSGVWLIGQRIQRKKDEALLRERQLSELQLKALRSQMNPHFVFNSLAAIQYFISSNQLKASEQYLVKFSKLIRRFFELSKLSEISLEKEIELLQNYLEIEKLRFKEKLDFEISIDPEINLKGLKIPTMLLQPIVENAVNHGIFNKEENGKVTLRFALLDPKTLRIQIIDDGVGFKNTQNKAFGRVKSSSVLKDRLSNLNKNGKWQIKYKNTEKDPSKTNKGNIATFILKT